MKKDKLPAMPFDYTPEQARQIAEAVFISDITRAIEDFLVEYDPPAFRNLDDETRQALVDATAKSVKDELVYEIGDNIRSVIRNNIC